MRTLGNYIVVAEYDKDVTKPIGGSFCTEEQAINFIKMLRIQNTLIKEYLECPLKSRIINMYVKVN